MKNARLEELAQRDVDRCLTLLRNKIHQQGSTQLEVQQALGWGRSYISQLVTHQKELRLRQILLILGVIGYDPAEFFGELYPQAGAARERVLSPEEVQELSQGLRTTRAQLRGLTTHLLEIGVIGEEELTAAVEGKAAELAGADFTSSAGRG